MDWGTYVREVVGNDRQVDVAARTGIDQTTISRWLRSSGHTGRVSSQNVVKFARGYKRDVLEAFVVAGILPAEDVDMAGKTFTLEDVESSALLAELQRRERSNARHSPDAS